MPAEAIQVKCPHCGAEPGQKCKNYKGKGCAPHRARAKAANPADEHWRQARLKTEREHKKIREELPLFAGQAIAEGRTVEDNYWRTRFMVAGIKEDSEPRTGFWADWDVHFLKQLARRVLPPGVYQDFCTKKWVGDERMFWTKVLTTTEKVVGTYQRISHGWLPMTGDKDGLFETPAGPEKGRLLYLERVELVPTHSWPPEGWVPPFTPEEMKGLLATPPPGELDDGGLWARVDAALRVAGRAGP